MNVQTLNSAKSCFADNRCMIGQGLQAVQMANTAAYLTSAISEETYSVVLLSSIATTVAFEWIDATVCTAAQSVPSISNREAKEKAEQIIQAAKAEAAFRENEDLKLYLEERYGLPKIEKFQEMGRWEQIKEAASFLSKPPLFALKCYLRSRQMRYIWNTYGNLWLYLLGEKVVESCLRVYGQINEIEQDRVTLNRWLTTLKTLSPDDKDHPIHQELEKDLEATLNRVTASNLEMGLEFAKELFPYRPHFNKL